MKNLIFSLFIEYEDDDFADTGTNNFIYSDENKKNKFQIYKDQLIECKNQYAEKIKCDFVMETDEENLNNFIEKYNLHFLSKFDKINFYKIYLFYKHAENYDNILYLDFDVVPNTDENFFEVHDLSQAIYIKTSNKLVDKVNENNYIPKKSIRSPFAKYYNTYGMLLNDIGCGDNNVFNTGIVGMSKKSIFELSYFDDFEKKIDYMTEIKQNKDKFFPDAIADNFNYDNETLFSYLIEKNNVTWCELDDNWHYIYDKQEKIDNSSKLIHFINKRFEDYFT